jgi:hypothetical protein
LRGGGVETLRRLRFSGAGAHLPSSAANQEIRLSNSTRDKNTARDKAQRHFSQYEQRSELVKREMEKERDAIAARTNKLRQLRLAKEAEDAAEKLKNTPVRPAPRKRKAHAEPAPSTDSGSSD